MQHLRFISGLVFVTVLMTGCFEKKPFIEAMQPIELDKNITSNLSEYEVQTLLSKTVKDRIQKNGGGEYLINDRNNPNLVGVATKKVSYSILGDGSYWQYAYAYGYEYQKAKNAIVEKSTKKCIRKNVGSQGNIWFEDIDCDFSVYYPDPNYIQQLKMLREYILTTFPEYVKEYNSKKQTR